MRKLVFWLIGLPLAVVAAVFAVNNRDAVSVSLWPTPFSVDLPLYLLCLGALVIGLVVGGSFTWIGAAKLRVRLRDRDLEIRGLKRDLEKSLAENQTLVEVTEAQKVLPPAA
ncbi:MAG: LapA family protein [Rhodospirillum sp.]|nr:LapA family protein [Rhodospirillum sp.]MCF8490466.1 LapA family protein [Rhodospirillum sp.]MCF8500837.1 LapA family protein [Rhodospirillum sp.]